MDKKTCVEEKSRKKGKTKTFNLTMKSEKKRSQIMVFLLFLLLCTGCMNQEREEPETADRATITHYALHVLPSLEDHTLSVKADVTVEIPEGHTLVTFFFDPGLYISQITDEVGNTLKFYRESNLVNVEIQSLAPQKILTFNYKGVVYRRFGGQTVAYVGQEGCWVTQYYWYPTIAVFTEEGQQIYYPWDSRNWAGATFSIEVPESWTVITSGELISQKFHEAKTTWTFETKDPLPSVDFAAGEYYVTTQWQNGKEIMCCLSQHKDNAQEYMDLIMQIFTFYSEKFGDYPFESFSVVELPETYGLDESKPWFITASSVFDKSEKECAGIVSEMIALQWWGFSVTGSDAPSFYTLRGCFPHYASLLFMREFYGEDISCQMLTALRSEVEKTFTQRGPESMVSIWNLSRAGRNAVVAKTVLMMQALKEEVGEDTFFEALKEIGQEYRCESITMDSIQETFETVSETDLSPFFDSYYYGTDIPPSTECGMELLSFAAEKEVVLDELESQVEEPSEGLSSELKLGIVAALVIMVYFFNLLRKRSRLAKIALKKVGGGAITLFFVMSMLFFILHAVPGGDPVDRMFPFAPQDMKQAIREDWGLDKPLFYQYLIYLKKVITLDFKPLSGERGINAMHAILFLLPFTLLLFGTAIILSYTIGTVLGVYLLSKKKSQWRTAIVYAFIGFYILPAFVLGIFFKSWLIFKLTVFPPVSISIMKGTYAFPLDLYYGISNIPFTYTEMIRVLLPEMILPVIVLVLVGIARPLLLMRDQMALTLGEPYIMTARAKGLKEKTIRFKHIARCALLPLVNDASINLVYIFGGGILIEYVFSWPGVGLVLFEALKKLNFPFISAAIFVLACVLVVSMIVADVLSAYLDPRIGVVK